jgi:hypothetical protein
MAAMVEVIARTPGTVMLEGGRVGGYVPTKVSAKYWGLMGRKFGHMVMTVEAYASHIRKLDEVQLRAECKRRRMDKGGTVHEMRAALLDGIAPYEPSKHTEEPDEDEQGEVLTLAERVQNAESRDDLKALADEAGLADDVDMRFGADKLRDALLDALDTDDSEDTDEQEEDSEGAVGEQGEGDGREDG